MQVAVIDSGTNTFALNIYENLPNGEFKRIYKERYFVELLECGRESIGEAPFRRALEAYLKFSQTLHTYQITRVRALGTAALRVANNGALLMEEIYDKTGLQIEVITGDREAELIYKGVRLASPIANDSLSLVMDIGGGSVEFIICDKNKWHWAQSFHIGAAVLYDLFRPSNPIEPAQIQAIYDYLVETLSPLWAAVAQYKPSQLVGASGTFDVLVALAGKKRGINLYEYINLNDFQNFMYPKLIHSTYEQRLKMPELPPTRAKLIIGVLVLIKEVIERCNIQTLAVSDYALREGTAWEMLQQAD